MGWIHQTKLRFFKILLQQKAAEVQRMSPTTVELRSASAAVQAFHRARKHSVLYARMLKERGVDPDRIRTISDFQNHVPIIDKKALYSSHDATDLFPNLLHEPSGRVWSSSGTSGAFSFGFEPPRQLRDASFTLDFMMNRVYNTASVRTIVLNCLTNPWPLVSNFAHYADVSTRTDIAVHLLEKLSDVYEQFVIAAEPLLLKKLLEEAREAGIPLEQRRIHLISGGEFVSEHFRQYLLSLLNGDTTPNGSSALLSMGFAEFGIGLLFEMPALAALRSRIAAAPSVFKSLVGNFDFCPQIFQYNPFGAYVETPKDEKGKRRLVLTNLSGDALPLIRYDCGDLAERMSYDDFVARVQSRLPEFRPDELFPFPFVLATGKEAATHSPSHPEVSVDAVKDLLYSFHGLLPHLTGCFHLSPKDSAATALRIQLREHARKSDLPPEAVSALERAARERGLAAEWIQYSRFPVSMGLRFDKKFKYM